MNRRNFVRTAAMVPLAAGCAQLGVASASIGKLADDRNSAGTTEKATDRYPLRERYELTLGRVLSGSSPAYTEEFLLADVRPVAERRFTEFSGDLSGRYIGALASATAVYGRDFAGLDELVEKVIALQKADGYFGGSFNSDKPTDQDLALLWGNGRLLVGLVEYYQLKPSAQVLAACRKLGDFLLKIGPLMLSKEMREAFGAKHFASSYICWMQQTEGLAGLYVITKDQRYRKLAQQIADVIERRPGDHVHGYLTSLRGVMDLYGATGDRRSLEQCRSAWTEIRDSKDLLMTGGVPEGWSPNNHRTEGCGEADWVRLSLQLWEAEGGRTYLEAAERAIFNEFALNQFATGDFGHRHYTDTGLPAEGAARAWWCCTLHGLRCFPAIHENVFSNKDGIARYDLPLDGRIENPNFSTVAESNLAEDGTAQLRFLRVGGDAVEFEVRKPDWAESLLLLVNGESIGPDMSISHRRRESSNEVDYFRFRGPLKAGDIVTVKYGLHWIRRGVGDGDQRASYTFGPWTLGASAADNPDYFNELTTDNRLVAGKEAAQAADKQPTRAFSVPIAATLIPVLHAEYPDQPGNVVLRAIAEQTGLPTTSWEVQFLTKDRG